jgi:hypothetical protein
MGSSGRGKRMICVDRSTDVCDPDWRFPRASAFAGRDAPGITNGLLDCEIAMQTFVL